MRYLSVCSGIEAATAAWHPLGWIPAAFSEIEAFPRAVLSHHYPDTPLHGDFTTIGADEYGPIDLLVGGTPCQSFSVAGLRGGLDDDRGNLALEYLRLADRTRPRWLVWENVPGVLSSNGGRDFGAILGGMVELGYSFSYRVVDAQFCGVAQQRRRVFVVGHLGDWRASAAVLFERHSLSGHPAPRRQAGQEIARSLRAQSQSSHRADSETFVAAQPVAKTLMAKHTRLDPELESYAISFGWQNSPSQGDGVLEDRVATLDKSKTPAVAFKMRGGCEGGGKGYLGSAERAFTLATTRDQQIHDGVAVRRLTPRECERLQGFPDDYTLIPYRGKPAADGPRYKALGNSMAVPVMRWLGERIAMVEALQVRSEAA